jgi:hypothetical protein
MVVNTGKTLLEEESLFTLEVHLGEVDETFEQQGNLAAAGSMHEHDAQVIERIHEDAVLIVDGLNANNAFVTPRQQRHISLREQGQV